MSGIVVGDVSPHACPGNFLALVFVLLVFLPVASTPFEDGADMHTYARARAHTHTHTHTHTATGMPGAMLVLERVFASATATIARVLSLSVHINT